MRISPFPKNWVRTTLSQDLFEPFCLVAVVSSKGSVPRTTGAAMLVYKNQIMGSVGGGELEYQAIETAQSGLLQSGFKRSIRSFALGPSLGQCCGGAVNLMFEWYGHDNRSVLAALNSEIAAFTEHDIVGERIPKLCLKLSQTKTNSCINLQLNPPHNDVFLYGAGHVGRAVAEIARHLCCQLYWVDTQENRFPETIPIGVVKICASSPSHIASHAPENSIHLVMTYSHQIDYDVVSCLLSNGHFAKCGLIGSETKAARFRSRLLNAGLTSEQVERLVCPIGLAEIRGKAPFQIALSIAGQLSSWIDDCHV